jgi:adenylate kinase family enzyme
VLSATDPLPARPRRVVVAGTSGTGKTTLVRAIAARLGLPSVELDALHHGPDWVPRPEFLAEVDAFTSADGWITEWQYPAARPLLADRADLLVWLDLPFRTTLRRVVIRTVRRRVRREELWNGNREAPLWTFFTDRDHIVRWAVRTRHDLATWLPELERTHPALPIVRLTTSRDVDDWVSRIV